MSDDPKALIAEAREFADCLQCEGEYDGARTIRRLAAALERATTSPELSRASPWGMSVECKADIEAINKARRDGILAARKIIMD